MNQEDLENTKRALDALGLYEPPQLFVERFSNDPMIQGLKKFQRQEGLEPDGVMNPDGPTHRRMNEVLEASTNIGNLPKTNSFAPKTSVGRPSTNPRPAAIRLFSEVGANRANHAHDIVSTKRALAMLGEFPLQKATDEATEVDSEFINSLERFQELSNVKIDGWMRPKGETEQALEGRIEQLIQKQGLYREEADQSNDHGETTQVAAAPVPAIVYKIAEVFGMAVMAAWAWWLSMSKTEQKRLRKNLAHSLSDDELEERCDNLLYNIDTPMCNSVSKKRGKAAGAKCRDSASERYAACLKGTPIDQLPPLNIWNH